VAALQAAAADIMKEPQVRARLQAIDLVTIGSTSAEAQQVMRAEMARWEPIVRRLGLKSD
jgi:tripartite-type tricarboxylate transporter receptor subunit TctC